MENKNIPNLNFTIKDAIAKSQEININDILKKICVSPPYFAFKKIYKYQNYFIAPFRVEQSEHQEGNKISIAESGRHLAIAGSIANAFTTNSKHYYLAMNALMNFYQQSNASDLFVEKKFKIIGTLQSVFL